MWCVCSTGAVRNRGFVAYPDLDSQLWVHSPCERPTRMVFEKLTLKRTPRGALALLSVVSRAHGVTELTFAMGGGVKSTILTVQSHDRRPFEMGINPNDVLLNTWQRLDLYTEMIMTGAGGEPEVLAAKAKARAYAEVLADFMPPFFTDPDEVVKEAIRRYKAREAEDDEYETPGLGVKSLDAFDKQPMKVDPRTVVIPVEINDKQRASIKLGLESKMFTVAQLAKTYGVKEAVIEAIRSA